MAFSAAVSFTAVVCVVWLYHAPAKLNSVITDSGEGGQQPFSQVFDQIGSQVSAARESISQPEDETLPAESTGREAWQQHLMNRASTATSATSTVMSETEAVLASSTLASSSSASSSDITANAPRTVRIVTVPATTTATTSSSSQPSW